MFGQKEEPRMNMHMQIKMEVRLLDDAQLEALLQDALEVLRQVSAL